MTNAEHQARYRAKHGKGADPGNAARQQQRALRILDGCTEAILLAHGFKIDFLAGLVRDGLVKAEPSTMRAGGRQVVVVWMQITAAGRRAAGGTM